MEMRNFDGNEIFDKNIHANVIKEIDADLGIWQYKEMHYYGKISLSVLFIHIYITCYYMVL